jgi:hypothetical protein
MGRYYTGDIEGKFWFAIQSSDDASFFGGSDEDTQDGVRMKGTCTFSAEL